KCEARCCRCLRNQTRLRHARQRIRFETVKSTLFTHAKIDSCITTEFECTKRATRTLLNLRCLRCVDLRGKLFDRHSCLVLALVVVNLVRSEERRVGKECSTRGVEY